jgi:uncharacterized protein with beta-barrel porin domain
VVLLLQQHVAIHACTRRSLDTHLLTLAAAATQHSGRHTTVKVTQEISTNPCTTAASGASDEDVNGSAHSASFDSATATATAAAAVDGASADSTSNGGATANGHKALVTLPPPLLQREASNQSMGEYTL